MGHTGKIPNWVFALYVRSSMFSWFGMVEYENNPEIPPTEEELKEIHQSH